MTREQKLKRDKKTLEKYARDLQARPKIYSQRFASHATNQRKSRAAALGECCLQAMDAVRGLAKTKPLRANSLIYAISEIKDKKDGVKTFYCQVAYQVISNERGLTDEEVRDEVTKLAEKLNQETEEMFPEEK